MFLPEYIFYIRLTFTQEDLHKLICHMIDPGTFEPLGEHMFFPKQGKEYVLVNIDTNKLVLTSRPVVGEFLVLSREGAIAFSTSEIIWWEWVGNIRDEEMEALSMIESGIMTPEECEEDKENESYAEDEKNC